MAKLYTLPSSTAEAKVLLGSALIKGRVKSTELVEKSSTMAASLISTTMTFSLIIAISVFLYGTFYYAYMPVEMVNLPVNLAFEPCEGQTSARCTFPTASLAMGRHQQLLQGQAYTIRLSLDIPDSPKNEDLGMFMACMDITGKNQEVISNSCKSSVTEYRSPMLRTLTTLAYLPLLLTSFSHQRQSLQINFFQDFHPDPHRAAEAFNVQLKSSFIQVTSAKLHVEASLSGLRHLMYRHSWISAVLGIGTNIFILFTIIGVSWARFRVGHAEMASAEVEMEEENEQPELEGEVVEEQQVQEAAVVVEQPRASDLSLGKKLKSYLMGLVFKVLVEILRVVLFVVLGVIFYEAVLQGTDATRESLSEAVQSNLVHLATFVLKLMQSLVARVQQ